MAEPFDRIVYADNSEADLSPVQALDDGRLEVLRTSRTPPEHGRGYGEIRIIEDAMRESTSIGHEPVWKVSGRYVVSNIGRLVRTAPACDVYVNIRWWPRPWCDSYAFAFNREGYDDCFAPGSRDDVGIRPAMRMPIEVALAYGLESKRRQGSRIETRFRHEPRVRGLRAKDARAYEGPKQRLKWASRTLVRHVAPRVPV